MSMSNDTALTVVSEQEQFNARQLDIIRNQIAKGASEEELSFFLEVCRMTGLNPLHRQIYAVMRGQREQVNGEWRTVQRMTIQTGIDGYRLIAARTGQLAGIDDPTYDSEDADHPMRASVTVWRFVGGHRVPFTATARWAEYAQVDKDGKPQSMWKKMPYLMLGKCAESLALRKAFPAELSGVYTGEEMQQADSDYQPVGGYVEAMPATAAPAATPTPIRQPATARGPVNITWPVLKDRALAAGVAGEDYTAFVKRLTGKDRGLMPEDKRPVLDEIERLEREKAAAEAKISRARRVVEEDGGGADGGEQFPESLSELDFGQRGA